MRIDNLLSAWCSALYSLQIRGTGFSRADGAIFCPACGRVHGRSSDAIYPFLFMASRTGDRKWSEGAERLFDWTERTVSLGSGGYANDIDSDWKGITVFSALQMLDSLEYHSDVMTASFHEKMEKRLHEAAEFLYGYNLLEANTNYPVSDALALYRLGKYFNEKKYFDRYMEYRALIPSLFTEDFLIFGESSPRDRRSGKGLLSVDIGYNTEETLPAITSLALIADDSELLELAIKGFKAHLGFMLPDGGWDNSFGTRNFKWTYWGSRTSDGAALALLELSEYESSFRDAAARNLELLEMCTSRSGLLLGGPGYEEAGQSPCVHHSFTHAKVLAAILDHGYPEEISSSQSHWQGRKTGYYRSLDTYTVARDAYTATVTGYDWPYMRGGHVSGGTLSLLHHDPLGPVIASGPAIYTLRERNNMQIPVNVRHECNAPRLSFAENGIEYSSIYDGSAMLSEHNGVITAEGRLKDADGNSIDGGSYRISYSFGDESISVSVFAAKGTFILPLIVHQGDGISLDTGRIIITRKHGRIIVAAKTGRLGTLYGEERIFNLVPGFEALPISMEPEAGRIDFDILFSKEEG